MEKLLVEKTETKVCSKCGRTLPIEKFRLLKGKFYNPYYLGECKECEYKYQREYIEKKNKITFSDNIEMLIHRKYKEIKNERILDISGLGIIPLGTDETFVKLMDYKNIWLSNYGRLITHSCGAYHLLQENYDKNGTLYYAVRKNVFYDGKWIFKNVRLYAAKAVVEEFVVNPDKENNVYIWHSGYDKQDCYYRNLYPLNQEQYRIVKNNFNKTGDDSEEFIIKAMNDIKYKPDNWSRKSMEPRVCGIGYHGSGDVRCKSESYLRWNDMLNRCYNAKFHERQPQYKECSVCEEWLNYNNFKVWYGQNKIPGTKLDMDKDILFKGNKVYSPETVAFVPHAINTLFLSGKSGRGDCPIGVYYDKEKGKFRPCVSYKGRQVKLGNFATPKAAFARYKQYKEGLIQNIAEQNKEKIPYKVYEAMMDWKIEITD